MNGDGYNTNDLFYVPKNALDPNEIQFTYARQRGRRPTQAQDLENFINASPCLSIAARPIMERNSCRNPFTHLVDFSLRQKLPSVRAERIALQFDIFNFGNLLNKNWGKLPFTPVQHQQQRAARHARRLGRYRLRHHAGGELRHQDGHPGRPVHAAHRR